MHKTDTISPRVYEAVLDTHAVPAKTRFWREATGPLLTVSVAAVIELLSRTPFKIPNPPAFLLLMVVFSAFRAGLRSGVISALAAWGYFAYYFSEPWQPFHYTDENFRRVLVWLAATPAIALLVGMQRRHIERLGEARSHVFEQASAFLEHLLATSPGIVYRRRPDDLAITYVSGNVQRLLGYAPEEMVGVPRFWDERIHPDDRARLDTEHARARAAKNARVEREYRFRHKDGQYRWLHSITQFEYDAAGHLAEVLGFVLDITDRKKAEAAVEEAKREADRANQAKNEFLSRMSHELRTPLNAILGFAQLLDMDSLTPEQREGVGQILKGGRHLLDLINEVLDIARIEAGRLHISLEAVSVREVVKESLDLIAPLAAAENIRVEAGEPSGYVLADRQRLKQILLNLLSNAVKYNRRLGTVAVSFETGQAGRIRIRVSDTGPGIAPDRLAQLFIPFQRLGIEESGVEGTGLGLALSKRLVEAMGGQIGVESLPGHGSTFWIELALADGPVERLSRADAALPAPGDPGPSREALVVLYIEDNLSNLKLIQRLLVHRPGVWLIPAMQGRLGLDLAREHRPQLIFLDLHLPDIPGEEVLHRLQADPQTRPIPVVIVSADATPGQIARLRAAGTRDYLTKPLDVKKFLALLDDALQSAPA
jgi:PAS domain S-box-containing protein